MFPVAWGDCDSLICMHVWWYEHNQDESVCVPNKVQCWLFCVPCWTGLCGAPATASCAEVYLPAYRCEEDVACVQVGHEPSVPTRRACVPGTLP